MRKPPEPVWTGEPSEAAAREVLKDCFGYAGFRPGQDQAISALLSGRDVLAVMPTGAGKSLCYQIPAAIYGAQGLTIVVSPLISLMADQVRSLKEAGIRGSYLNSTLTPRQQEVVMRRAEAGWYDLMYVAPERLDDPRFLEFCGALNVPLVAVDEAHCVSQWGQDFRPAYRRIAGFMERLPHRPPLIALTATATRQVRDDIVNLLGLDDPELVITGFDRPNLHLASFELTPKRRRAFIQAYCIRHPDESGIVYAQTRKEVDRLADQLREAGVSAAAYHAGYSAEDRAAAQRSFADDDVRVMVATNAFGMGIDKSDVRFVLNCGMPQTLEEYYQEAGRAGRDGEPASCILLWCRGDIRTCHYFIDHTEFAPELSDEEVARLAAHREALLGDMIGYAMSDSCLHQRILCYFGQKSDAGAGSCGACSACTKERPEDLAGVFDGPGAGGARAFGSAGRRQAASDGWELEPAYAGEGGEGDEELFQRLRSLRKELADERGVPPYVIFSDATLRAMVRMRPRTPEELLEVSGVSKTKLRRYGEEFLAEIAREP